MICNDIDRQFKIFERREKRMIWHHIEKGEGRPLLLLHGIGMSKEVWLPVMDRLATQRRVIALDIPGFGETPGLDPTTEPNSEAMVASLAQSLNEMDIDQPVDIAGNSLGGRIMFDAAVQGLARSIVGISPAGLWREYAPAYAERLFATLRKAYRKMPGVSEALLKTAVGRTVIMAAAVSVRGWKIPPRDAIRSARMFAESRHFESICQAFRTPFLQADKIQVPCTVAFGDFDLVFPPRTRDKTRAPSHTHWVRLPGCGHVPMWDNPALVSSVILKGTH